MCPSQRRHRFGVVFAAQQLLRPLLGVHGSRPVDVAGQFGLVGQDADRVTADLHEAAVDGHRCGFVALLGRPKDFLVTVREIQLAAGAGYVVPITGEIMRMPGLPSAPLAGRFDLSDEGEIVMKEE